AGVPREIRDRSPEVASVVALLSVLCRRDAASRVRRSSPCPPSPGRGGPRGVACAARSAQTERVSALSLPSTSGPRPGRERAATSTPGPCSAPAFPRVRNRCLCTGGVATAALKPDRPSDRPPRLSAPAVTPPLQRGLVGECMQSAMQYIE